MQTGAQTGAQRPALAEVIRLEPRRKTRSKRRAKDPYRGVRHIPPKPPKHPNHRLRYLDPDSGKERDYVLTPAEAENIEGVRERIWNELRDARFAQKRAIRDPHVDVDRPIKEAVDSFFSGRGATLAEGTQVGYRESADRFLEYCRIKGIRTVRHLSKAVLSGFVDWLVHLPKQVARKGGKKGEKRKKGTRVNHTKNKDIRHVRAILNRLRKSDVIRLSRDDIADALEELRAEHHKKPFLRPEKIALLMKACRDYDAEHERPILPAILFLLLTGCRVEEAVLVEWSMIEETSIELPANITKTKHARSVHLSVTPLLAKMLQHRKGRAGRLLEAYSVDIIEGACRVLVNSYGAPKFTAQTLRRTCGTYLCCAPSIYGAAAPHMAAARLGHGIGVSQKNYVGVIEISRKAKTIEDAMQIKIDSKRGIPRL